MSVPQVLREYLPGGYIGHDKEGSTIRVELFGRLDMRGIMASSKKSDLERTKLLQCETIVRDWEEQSKRVGKMIQWGNLRVKLKKKEKNQDCVADKWTRLR